MIPMDFLIFCAGVGRILLWWKKVVKEKWLIKDHNVENNYIESCCQIQDHYNQFQGVPINVI